MLKSLWRIAAAGALLIAIVIDASLADDAPMQAAAPDKAASSDEPKVLTWHHDLDTAINEARRRGKPILVKAGAKWCIWCRKLEPEIAKPEVQKELAEWVLVDIDIEEYPDDARRLNVGSIPAMRILGPDGRTTSSREGFLTATKLLSWLESTGENVDGEATVDAREITELTAEAVTRLVRQLDHRDASVREAVIRRLSLDKGLSAVEVVKAFATGNLAKRLAVLELLSTWKAPVEGIDPWQPETLTEALLNDLEVWANEQTNALAPTTSEIEPLTPEQLGEARLEIAKVIAADTVEAEAIGARLARIGSALLPEVREQYQHATSDKVRARLDWLRYRLISTDSLSLRWPGGLGRLASTDARTRHEAAGELAENATGGDESLLIELFSHPDPLMRELSLKALQGVEGTRAYAQLSRLLVDPEPNVRAAVLKQLSEKPSTKLVPQIAKYVAQEKDPDLVVHAVRLLRAIKGKEAIDCLIGQLTHSNWQVRAETVDALGEILTNGRHGRYGGSNSNQDADTYAAILEVVSDDDGFVVSRAVNALKDSDLALAAGPLAKSAEQHPELANEVGQALTAGNNIRQKALPLLKLWLKHADDRLRAAAINSLSTAADLDGETELIPALSDPSERVRLAAAGQLLRLWEAKRPNDRQPVEELDVTEEMVEEVESSTFLGSILKLFTQTKPNPPKMAEAPKAVEDPKVDHPTSKKALDQHPSEVWLADFRSGRKRPKWIGNAIEPLGVMLGSTTDVEQVASAVALVALGEDARAIPVLTNLATTDPRQTTAVAKVLGWLPWEQRLAFFEQLRQLAQDPDQVSDLCQQLVVLRDLRASATLWEVLSDDQMTANLAHSLFVDLQRNHHLDDRYSQPPRKPVGVDNEQLQRLTREGKIWQQRVAMALLLLVDESKAAESAKAISENPQAPAALRQDAFCVLMIASETKEAKRLAVTELTTADSVAVNQALAYLTLGENAVHLIADREFYLQYGRDHMRTINEKEDDLPKELSAENVRPLLDSPSEDTAAQAAYLLALLGEPEGLDRLIRRWRKAGIKDHQWQPLVYKAIAAGDDPRRVPILDEIYRSMAERPYEVRGLYWAIRSMNGPEVLRLRKRIRDEVGMDKLR